MSTNEIDQHDSDSDDDSYLQHLSESDEECESTNSTLQDVVSQHATTINLEFESFQPSNRRQRSFKFKSMTDPEPHGRYIANSSLQAANKAFSVYCNIINSNLELSDFKFAMFEVTPHSRRNIHWYSACRERLIWPIRHDIVQPDGTALQIVNRFKNVLRRLQNDEIPS